MRATRRCGVDSPHEPRAGGEPVGHLGQNLARPVIRRQHFDHEIRSQIGEPLRDGSCVATGDNAGLFTWWAPWRNLRARNIGWRLDYMLASPTVAARASACVVEADVGTSDHSPVGATTVGGPAVRLPATPPAPPATARSLLRV